MVWMQRAKRASANPALDVAISLADALALPVIASFCLVPDYPEATLRAYHFITEGLADLPDALSRRRIGWEL
jgi:deoxyribodipyrimidine photo-lyase